MSSRISETARRVSTRAGAAAAPGEVAVSERDAALTLEAMRLGVVPSADLSAYTVGRERELGTVDEDLARVAAEGGAVRGFLGDYGAGKTHLLELIRARALAKGFLVAEATLDPSETSPSHPKRVYRALVRSLVYPDRPHEEGLGLRPLLEKGSGSEAAAERFRTVATGRRAVAERLTEGAHLYLTPALQYMARLTVPARRGRKEPRAGRGAGSAATGGGVSGRGAAEVRAVGRSLLVDWLEGHPTLSNQVIDAALSRALGRHDTIYSLLDFRPWARIYAYLLSGLSVLARSVGYSGLVILLDEAEFYSLLSAENRGFAQTLFQALSFAAVGGSDAGATEALPFDEEALSRGGYGIQQTLPAAYDRRAGLYTVVAMTPNPDGLEALYQAVPRGRVAELAPLSGDDFVALSERVCAYYAGARPDWELPGAIVAPLGKVLTGLIGAGFVENPRQAMKFIIEFLDVVRFHRDRVGQVIRSLSEQVLF
jgi:hypothetical protein